MNSSSCSRMAVTDQGLRHVTMADLWPLSHCSSLQQISTKNLPSGTCWIMVVHLEKKYENGRVGRGAGCSGCFRGDQGSGPQRD